MEDNQCHIDVSLSLSLSISPTLPLSLKINKNISSGGDLKKKKMQCVSFHHYNGGICRCAQVKQWVWTQGQWPKNSSEFLLHMPKNVERNAELKGLDVDSLVTEHIQVNKSPNM